MSFELLMVKKILYFYNNFEMCVEFSFKIVFLPALCIFQLSSAVLSIMKL